MTTQNPFKTNSNNSRFSRDNFFANDETKSSFSRVKEKKEKDINKKSINDTSESKEQKPNSFLQDNKKFTHKKENKYYQNFKNDIKYDKNYNDNKNDFNINVEDFPVLCNVDDKQIFISPQKTFTDAVNTINIIEDNNEDKIKPGWVVISKNKETNKQEFIYGETTPYQVKLQERENNMTYIINCIHIELNRLWNKNVQTYDSINGEGTYEETFYLPPVYDDFEDYNENEFDEDEFDIDNSDPDRDMSDIDYNSDYY